MTTDRLDRPLYSRTDVICDGCDGAILQSERRAFGVHETFCGECADKRGYDVITPDGLARGRVRLAGDGWRFTPYSTARQPSRVGHQSARIAISRYIRSGYTLVPRAV